MFAAGALTLARSPVRVVRVGTRTDTQLAAANGDVAACQADEAWPAEVSAIRLSLVAYYGSRVRVVASSGSRVLTEGSRGHDWTGRSLTAPVPPVKRPRLDGEVPDRAGLAVEARRRAGHSLHRPRPEQRADPILGNPHACAGSGANARWAAVRGEGGHRISGGRPGLVVVTHPAGGEAHGNRACAQRDVGGTAHSRARGRRRRACHTARRAGVAID